MSDSDQPDEHQLEPDEPMTTRREAMAAGAALFPMFLFGDDSDLGYFETHRVLDTNANGETVTDLGIDPDVLAFAEGLTVEERPDGGVQITTKDNSELSQWAERDDGTLEGPALSTGKARIAKTHSPDSSDDLQTVIDNNAGEIIDLAGQTFEISSPLSVPDHTTVRNGTVKLANGADSDIFYCEDPVEVVLEDLYFDLNGANQTTDSGPTNTAYWTMTQSSSRAGRDNIIRNCIWRNGSDRVTSATPMVFIRAERTTVESPIIVLGNQANIFFDSRQQLSINNPIIHANNRTKLRGLDGQIVGGNIISNDVGIVLQHSSIGDWEIGGGLYIEDNRMGIYVGSSIQDFNTVHVGDVQLQGQTERGIFIDTGAATTGRFVVDGVTSKRNGYGSSGGYPHIEVQDGQRVVVRNVTATNDPNNDANYFIDIASGAESTILDGIDALDSDYTSGVAINDNGTGTNIGQTFTT